MITQDIYLGKINWHIKAYYAVDTYYTDEIINDLVRLGCKGEDLERARENLTENDMNTGLTYSNFETRETVLVIALSSSAEEYYNSFCHEQLHVMQHISSALGIDAYGEEICYIFGALAQQMYRKAKSLLCECCYRKIVLS